MNWVARAKEAFLGVPVSHSTRPPEPTPNVLWDCLPTLRAAINESLTGSSITHPAAHALVEIADVRRYLILAAKASDAAQIDAAVRHLVPHAHATIFDLQNDCAEVEKWVASNDTASARYDAILATLPLYSGLHLDIEALLTALSRDLTEYGRLWLNLYPDFERPEVLSAQVMTLLNEMLELVPSRWRLRTDVSQILDAHGNPTPSFEFRKSFHEKFHVVSRQNRGGALLGPLFAAGCIAPEIDEDEEGRKVLQALYVCEQELILSGELLSSDCIYVARPRRHDPGRVRQLFEKHVGPPPDEAIEGMSGPLPQWLKFNIGSALLSARSADHAAPFPPEQLMYHTTGLTKDRDFAHHGADILRALSAASPKPLNTLEAVLDFGVGVGRVARYFKGFSGRYVGVDIDQANLDWVLKALPWVEATVTEPGAPLPFEAAAFDGVISVSVFTHVDRSTTEFYVKELHRVTRRGGIVFVTLHGERALARALAEETVAGLMGVARERLELAASNVAKEGFDFAEQHTHLTRSNYRYGTTFLSQAGAESIFGRRFRVLNFVPGAIHSFQDLIVLEHC